MRGQYSTPTRQFGLIVTGALFLLAGPLKAQIDLEAFPTVAPSFAGIDLNQQGTDFSQFAWPASPNAAVGPQHVLEVTNQTVAIYDRTGQRLSHVRLRDFLSLNVSGVKYQATFDPRVLFDSRTGRWFAACVAAGNGNGALPDPVLLGISRTSDPTGDWDKYLLPLGEAAVGNDFKGTGNLTLGIDSTALYFGARIFPESSAETAKIAATKLSTLVAAHPSLGPVTQFKNLNGLIASPQPATNFDSAGSQWFAASVEHAAAGVRLYKLTWNDNTPTLAPPLDVSTPAYGAPIDVPQKGTVTLVDAGSERVLSAVVRNGHLWLSRTVGVNANGGSSSPDRTACEWMEINTSAASPVLAQGGRVAAPGNTPRSYFVPTLSVNSASDVVLSYSGSSATEFISAFYSSRLHTDPVNTLSAVQTLKAGAASYERMVGDDSNPFGRYGTVVIDPTDGFSFWSCQSYAAATATKDSWGTWIARIQLSEAPPPPPLPGKAKVKPRKLAFGKVKTGRQKTKTFTVSSKGENPLIGNVGAAAAPYSVPSGGGAFNLARGAKLKVTVQFTPAKRGAAPPASLAITTNDPDHPSIAIKLTGAGK